LGARAISQVLAYLLVIGVVVAASAFAAGVITGILGVYRPGTSASIIGGRAFTDPSDPQTVVADISVSLYGPDPVAFTGVRVVYRGSYLSATCVNCGDLSNTNSANDIVHIRFYFRLSSPPSQGDRFTAILVYSVRGVQGQTSAEVQIS